MRPSAREAFILITLLLDSLGFGLVSPVLPRLVEELTGAGPSEAGSVFGLLNSAYAGALFLCSPVLGRLSDRFGRRPVILLSLAGAVVNYTLAATAHALWLLFMARLVGGICGANAAPAAAYVRACLSWRRPGWRRPVCSMAVWCCPKAWSRPGGGRSH